MGQVLTSMKKKEHGLKFEAKEEYFIRNGGVLLEKQIALSRGQDIGARQLKIFSIKDIEKATNCFDPDLILGGVLGNAYQGILKEPHVAIRVPLNLRPKPELIDIFLTEASTRVVMNHNNMVKIYGCCLDTCIPILVYEFLPNRTLYKHLRGSAAFTRRLEWVDRLKVATDVSYALSYMHNALLKPVVSVSLIQATVVSFHSQMLQKCPVPDSVCWEYHLIL